MSTYKKTALVLGANGLIGNFVVDYLLKNKNYAAVYVVSRKAFTIEHPRMIQIVADKENIQQAIATIKVDHLFSCLGTTRAKTPDLKEYYKIDHDYPISVAKTLKEKGCSKVCLVSSMGANTQSKNFYLKLKGETEQSLIGLGFESTIIFRPALLIGKRKENRFIEKIAQKAAPLLDFIMRGPLKHYKTIEAYKVAKAMINISLSNLKGIHILQTQDIKEQA